MQKCKGCDQLFEPSQNNQIFHDPACRKAAGARRHSAQVTAWKKSHPDNRYSAPGQHTTDKGTINELRVASDLLTHGFIVYKNLSTRGSDLVMEKNNRLWRVEVKSGFRSSPNGRLCVSATRPKFIEVLALADDHGIRYVNLKNNHDTSLNELTDPDRTLFN